MEMFSMSGTSQKMKFSIKNFFSKCDQTCGKFLMEIFAFCAVRKKQKQA